MTVDPGGFGPMKFALIVGAILDLLAFARLETRVPSPLVNLHILRAPELRAGLALMRWSQPW